MSGPTTPTIDEALQAMDDLGAEHGQQFGPGRPLVPWNILAFSLFPRGDGGWARPKNQPHGRDQSAAAVFMEDLKFHPKVRTVHSGGRHWYGRKEHD